MPWRILFLIKSKETLLTDKKGTKGFEKFAHLCVCVCNFRNNLNSELRYGFQLYIYRRKGSFWNDRNM